MNQHDHDRDELRRLNAQFIHNVSTNDVPAHDAITHERFLCISSSGARVERAEYLREWATGGDPGVLTYWDVRDERIDVYGGTALVRATTSRTSRKHRQSISASTPLPGHRGTGTAVLPMTRGRWIVP